MKGIPSFSFNSCNVFQLGWVGGISLWKTLTGKERHFSGCDVDLSTFIRRSFNLRQRSAPSEFDNWSVLLPFVTFLTHCPVWNITFLLSHFILRKKLKFVFFFDCRVCYWVQVNNFQINSSFRQLSQNMTTDVLLDCSSFFKFFHKLF